MLLHDNVFQPSLETLFLPVPPHTILPVASLVPYLLNYVIFIFGPFRIFWGSTVGHVAPG